MLKSNSPPECLIIGSDVLKRCVIVVLRTIDRRTFSQRVFCVLVLTFTITYVRPNDDCVGRSPETRRSMEAVSSDLGFGGGGGMTWQRPKTDRTVSTLGPGQAGLGHHKTCFSGRSFRVDCPPSILSPYVHTNPN